MNQIQHLKQLIKLMI